MMAVRALILALVFFAAAPAYAQFGLTADDAGFSIEVSPLFPEPGATASLRAHSTLYVLRDRSITWRVNGSTVKEGIGEETLTFTAPAEGESAEISAEVTISGSVLSAQTTIAPGRVDLLWESDGYIPPLYEGRARPSAGSNVRLFAIPHITKEGVKLLPKDLIFTWRRGGEILGDLSGRGRNSIQVAAPLLSGVDIYSIEVTDPLGVRGARASVRIDTQNPQLRLYEHHPLFGVLFHRAVPASATFPATETRFIVTPYFAPQSSPAALAYEWNINDTPIEVDSDLPNEITIDARSSTGVALIELTLTEPYNYFLQASGMWRIHFGDPSAVPGVFDPFRQSENTQ